MTETRTIHGDQWADYRPSNHRVSNLGPGFTLDVPGMTTRLTVHEVEGQPVIDWINTYGNVIANQGLYGFDEAGEKMARMEFSKARHPSMRRS